MYPRRLLVAAGVLAFAVSLVVLAPVGWLLRLAPDGIAERVSDPGGTLWRGSASLATQSGLLQVSWDSRPARLLLLTISADWTATGNGLAASGSVAAAPWGYRLQVERGELGPGWLGRIVTGTRVVSDQPLSIQGLDLELAPGGRVDGASGRLGWGPGTVQVAGRAEPLAVPALRGLVRAVDGRLRVLVDGESEPGGMLATLDVDPEARGVHLLISQRAARLVGAAPSSPRPPDEAFFELRQPLR
ncbi:MAG: type II secretion system protein N [Gammaproteobacteria bacterium]